jgi:hypothetical protein
MILGAFIGFLISRTLFTSIQVWVAWLSTLWMIIIIAGGIATLRKSSFNFCLFSSILLLPIASIPFLALSDTFSTTMMSETNIPFIIFITIVFLIIGLFPYLVLQQGNGIGAVNDGIVFKWENRTGAWFQAGLRLCTEVLQV